MLAAITCPQLRPPANGDVSTTDGLSFGSVALYTCNRGYTVQGLDTRACLLTGEWSGVRPNCTGLYQIVLKGHGPVYYSKNAF